MNLKGENMFYRSLFIDSSDVYEIKKWNQVGILDGVTTNQYIFLKEKINHKKVKTVIKNICEEMKDKPVSVELTNSTLPKEKLLEEAIQWNKLAKNIVIKVPLIPDTTKSLWVISQLIEKDIAINVTLLMTFEQLILSALAIRKSKKISFVSLFWGRTQEDHAKYRSRSDFMASFPKVGSESEVNSTATHIVEETASFIKEGKYENVKIITGSIRTASMVGEAFAAGSNIVTVTPEVLHAMTFSQRTKETLKQFDDAWKQLHQPHSS